MKQLLRQYWPTLLVALLVASAAFAFDRVSRQLRYQRQRDLVSFELDTVRGHFERQINRARETGMDLSRSMAVRGEVDEAAFEALAREIFAPEDAPFCVGWAPGVTFTAAYPSENCPRLIGQDAARQSIHDTRLAAITLRRGGVTEGPRQTSDNKADLIFYFPVETRRGYSEELLGILSVGVPLGKILDRSGATMPQSHIEIAISTGGGSGGLEEIVFGRAEISSEAPVFAQIALPGGGFTLLAVPKAGWNALTASSLGLWSGILGISLLIVGLTYLANTLSRKRHEAQQARSFAETRLGGLLVNLPGAAFTYTMSPGQDTPGPDDRLLFFNPTTNLEICGIETSLPEANAAPFWALLADPEEVERLAGEFRESARQMRPWHAIWAIRTPAGQRKMIDGRGHPTRLEDGSVQWVCLFVDATEQIDRDRELEEQRELALKAQKNESIGQLTGGVAHDFNNLLAVIMGNLELLRDEIEVPEQVEMIDASIGATRRGAELTRSMLAFARKARLQPRQLDLDGLVRNTQNWAGRTLPKTIVIETTNHAGLWTIEADETSTEAALLNLIVNARDAMPNGGTLTIETANAMIDQDFLDRQEVDLSPGRYVTLTVSDTGHGIPTENLSRVFEPFFSTKPPSAGSGLGLSMVLGFMQQSGGTVLVRSEPGNGTHVTLYFRATKLTRPAPRDTAEDINPDSARPSGRHVLLAEDENDVRAVLMTMLRRAGYRVTEAPTGDAALALYEAAPHPPFDLLLTDIVMPGKLQGTSLALALRAHQPQLPVIFMSGYTNEASIPEHGIRPTDLRLMKPVGRAALLDAIARTLDD
ncbi:ATP-binding protein [Tropicimonas sp. TH_r6]|uniref:ATP-binding protein n=1 Tax=Tropicimonas sp. TH_r6 TaxID=3082085 RepID=UPI002952AE39|nr:ATP-binding protein [Tropicimonas sp. TH_r6]